MKLTNLFRQCIRPDVTETTTDPVRQQDNQPTALPEQPPRPRPHMRISPMIWKALRCDWKKNEDRTTVVNTASRETRPVSEETATVTTSTRRWQSTFSIDLRRFSGSSRTKSGTSENAEHIKNGNDRENNAADDVNNNLPKNLDIESSAEPTAYRHPPFDERKYLTRYELEKLMPWGPQAERKSGLVQSHIDALKDVAAELDTVLAFRKVNPAAKYWIEHNAPVKDLTVKNKSEKGGPLEGLLVATDGRRGSTVDALDGQIFGLKLQEMIENHSLDVLENTSEEDADPSHKTLKVFDPEKKATYKMVFNTNESKFSVYKHDGDDFKPIRFKGIQGKPLTADYDAFDFYPRLKSKNFAGVKDIDTGALERSRPDASADKPIDKPDSYPTSRAVFKRIRQRIDARKKFEKLVDIVMNDVLELPEVRQTKGRLGRLTALDAHVIRTANEEIKKQSGYEHDALMHGKEKRNTQYPELCSEVFFVFPDGQTLMSTSWEQTQAVDYAIKQEEFLSTDNRVYNIHAGTKVLFHDQRIQNEDGTEAIPAGSGNRIDWDSRAAAAKLYDNYGELGKIVFDDPVPFNAKSTDSHEAGTSGATQSTTELRSGSNDTLRRGSDPRRPSEASIRSTSSVGSVDSASSTSSSQSIPEWLNSVVRRVSVNRLPGHGSPERRRSSLTASAIEFGAETPVTDSKTRNTGARETMTVRELNEFRQGDRRIERRISFDRGADENSSNQAKSLRTIHELEEHDKDHTE